MKSTLTTNTTLSEDSFFVKNIRWIIALVSIAIFANCLTNGYNLDDALVTKNHINTSRGLEAIGDIFTSSYYSDDMGYAYGYRPMVHLSFALEHEIFGENLVIGHLINVLLFACAAVLLFNLLVRLNNNKIASWIIVSVVLFIVHPIHSEVVASLKNRDELLAFVFSILTGLLLLKWIDKEKFVLLLLSGFFFCCAILAKKSSFPIIYIFMLALVLFKEVTIKKLIISFCLIAVIPCIIIAENDLSKLLLIVVISFLFMVGIIIYSKMKENKVFIYSTVAIYLIAFLLLMLLVKFKIAIVIFYAFLMVMMNKREKDSLILFILSSYLIYFLYQDFYLFVGQIIILFYVLIHKNFNSNQTKLLIIPLMASSIWIVWDNDYLVLLFLILICSICLLVKKYSIWILSLLLITIGVLFFIKPSFVHSFILLLFIPLGEILLKTEKLKKVLTTFPSILLFFLASYVVINNVSNVEIQALNSSIQDYKATYTGGINQSFYKEGRMLEPIENTLVMPHTNTEKIATVSATLGEYLRLMIFPKELSFYYGYAKLKTENLSSPLVWFSIFSYLGLLVLGCWNLRKRPFVSFGICWFVISILIFSNGVELVAGMVGERLAFTASAGFCIFIGASINWISPNFKWLKPSIMSVVIVCCVILLSVRTIARNSDWKETLTLMSKDIKHLENSAQSNYLLASALMETSVDDEVSLSTVKRKELQRKAIVHYTKALEIWPGFFNAAYFKGKSAISLGDTSLAISAYEQAVKIGNPYYLDPYYQLQDLYLQYNDAKKYLEINKKIFSIEDTNPKSYNWLARAYFMNNYLDSSIQILDKGLEKFPGNSDLMNNRKMLTDMNLPIE